MLWSGGRLLLVPKSELVFGPAEGQGEGPQITFYRDPATGEVNRMLWDGKEISLIAMTDTYIKMKPNPTRCKSCGARMERSGRSSYCRMRYSYRNE